MDDTTTLKRTIGDLVLAVAAGCTPASDVLRALDGVRACVQVNGDCVEPSDALCFIAEHARRGTLST